MKSILLIATGGTIATKMTEDGLVPQLTDEEILNYVPEISELCFIDSLQLFNIDSTNIRDTHWCKLVECIRKNYETYDGFVITHGTDTMAYTAAALSYLIQNSPKPIVITGSQKSIHKKETDAITNLRDSFFYALDDNSYGVHLVFNKKIILGTRARKTRNKSYNAFTSINFPETATIRNEQLTYILKEDKRKLVPKFYDQLDPDVFVLKLIPGIGIDIFNYLKNKYHALVIECFGVGGIPCYEEANFMDAIADWINSGGILVITTQVAHEGMSLDIYEVGYKIKKQFKVIEAYDMTLEAIITKLMWILGQTKDRDIVYKMFYEPIQYDIELMTDKK